MKKLLLRFFAILFLIPPIYSQSILERAAKAKNFREPPIPEKRLGSENPLIQNATQIGFTDYDYAGNQNVPEQLALYDIGGDGVLDPIGIYLQRFSDSGDGIRRLVMFMNLNGETALLPASDTTIYSGFGTIQVITEGPWADRAAIMFYEGGKTNLTLIDLNTFYYYYFHEELDFTSNSSSFCYLPDGSIYVVDSAGNLRKLSADNPTTSTETGITFDPTPSSYPLKSSPNGQYMATMAISESDQVILYSSDDFGETWNEEVIGENLKTEIDNRPNTYPLFSNFGQASYVLDSTGVIHIGMNGYGIHFGENDTTFAYPAIYWNSRDRDWTAISVLEEEGEELNGLYSGNGIGNAYPTPVVSENGGDVNVFYLAPEYENGVLQTYQGDGTANNFECYYTDIKMGYYPPYGNAENLGEPRISEVFPSVYDWIEIHTAQHPQIWKSWTYRFIYMVDAVPGCSLFDENSSSEDSYWKYDMYGIALTDINDDDQKVYEFSLSQNYPNPFNPATTISYTVPERSHVSIRVFNLLGEKVTELVNEEQVAGEYKVKFNAEKLPSGIYIINMNAGKYSKSIKSILLK